MADQAQYPTDEQIKESLDAYFSKGKKGLGAAEAKRAAEKNSPKA